MQFVAGEGTPIASDGIAAHSLNELSKNSSALRWVSDQGSMHHRPVHFQVAFRTFRDIALTLGYEFSPLKSGTNFPNHSVVL